MFDHFPLILFCLTGQDISFTSEAG